MKTTSSWLYRTPQKLAILCLLGAVILLFGTASSRAAGRQMLHDRAAAVAAHLTPLGRLQNTQHLSLAISLPLRNQQDLASLLQQISDPSSSNFRHYLTPEQFAARFGPSEADYQAVISFAKAHGLKVAGVHPNRTILDVEGSIPNIESAFHVTMWSYQHPSESRKFYAPNSQPSVDISVPILGISGLSNYALPQPRYKLPSSKAKAAVSGAHSATGALADVAAPSGYGGSSPNGSYMGNDFRTAYAPGVSLTGTGQTVGLVQFDGYTASDITYYESVAGRPNVPLTNVLLDNFGGAPTGNGGELEVSLDIEMAISMAPGLSGIIVYEAGPYGNWHDMLNRMATDNLAKQLSCSWYIPGGGSDPIADQIFQQMAAQGQSFFSASGDYDAFTGLIPFPGDTPYITEVGGTYLNTTGPGGAYASETVWNRGNGIGSGGGISTQYPIPTWQQGINMSANLGSTTMRNVPDVALTADYVYVRVDGTDQIVGGTSCAAPLWAGFTALINQQSLTNTGTSVGFLNPAIYALGKGSNYRASFHDTTIGNNFSGTSPSRFPATAGYDLGTGWGSPTGSGLINALAGPPAPIIKTLSPLPTGMAGSPYDQTLLAGGGTAPYTWSLFSGSLPSGLNLTAAGEIVGTPSATGTANFTVQVADSKGISSTSPFTLTIYPVGTPIIASSNPLPPATVGASYQQPLAATGGATPYTWTITSGSLPPNLSLSSGGVISGSPTTTGTSTFTVQVTGNDGLSSTSPFSLTVNPAPTPPTITSASPLGAGGVGAPYSWTLSATGGTTPYSWSIASGSLPPGLNLSSDGVISGMPTAPVTSSFTVQVTGADDLFSTKLFTLAISPPPPVITSASSATGNFGQSFSYQITATNNPTNYAANGLPAGLTLNVTTGLISGTPTSSGISTVTISASNSGGTGSAGLTLTVNQSISITDGPPPAADFDRSYQFAYTSSAFPAPTYSVSSGALPDGLTLSVDGVISGTPTALGTFTGAVTATNGVGADATQNFSILVQLAPSITNGPPPTAVVNTPYSFSYTSNGSSTFSIAPGTLPPGLSLSATGVISGTPTATGFYTGIVTASGSSSSTATQTFAINVLASLPVVPIFNPANPTVFGTQNTVSWSAVSGATKYDVQASATSSFATVTDSGWISATSYTFTGLAPGIYFYRVRSNNATGSPAGRWTQASRTDFNSDLFTNVASGDGNLYVTDSGNDTIRMVTSGGTVTTFAGVAGSAGSSDGVGSAARFNYPAGGAVDASGNVYVTDYNNDTVRKITPGGSTTTIAGLAGTAGSADGTGSAARFNGPFGVALDASGNLYIADRLNQTVRKITPAGVVSTLAGVAGQLGSSDGTGSAARFNGPAELAVDASGNIFVPDQSNSTVRKITPAGVVTTVAGAVGVFASKDGTGSEAWFNNPSSIAVDGSDNLYVTDNGNYTIRKITPDGAVTTWAGSPGVSGSTDGIGSAALFYRPHGIAVDPLGNVYVTDNFNQTVRKIAPGAVVSTLAGSALNAGSADGTGSAARFNAPGGAAVDAGEGIILSYTNSTFNSAGTLASTLISPTGLQSWGALTYTADSSGSGTALTIDVLDSHGAVLASNVSSGTDLSLIPAVAGASAIQLRANFSTSNPLATPRLNGWSVDYYDVQASAWSAPLSVTQSPGTAPAITSNPPPAGYLNVPYSFTYLASGNPTPTFTVTSGSLPPGLALSTAGVLSGTSTSVGTYTGIVTAANSVSPNATQAFSINIQQITPVVPRLGTKPAYTLGTTNTLSWPHLQYAILYDVQAFVSPPGALVGDSGWISNVSYTFTGLVPGNTYFYRVRSRYPGPPDQIWSQSSTTDFNTGILTNVTVGSGNLYVADSNNNTIRKVTPAGVVTTLVGLTGVSGTTDGTGSAARFNYPAGGAVDSSGNIYITDYNNNTVRKITPSGTTTTIAGLAGSVGSSDGTGSAARFNGPFGVALDVSGNLYVADRLNQTVRKITPTGAVSTIAGLAGQLGSSDGTGSAARFNGPAELAVDATGNIFVPDQSNSTIRKITPGGVVTTVAGTVGVFSSKDGTGTNALFNNPSSIAVDGSDNLYVTDNGNSTIRKITSAGVVTTFAGSPGVTGSSDGTGGAARFYRPHGIAVDPTGNVYVTDNFNDTVRRITSAAVVTTLAGSPQRTGGTDGTGSVARFNGPSGVTVDATSGVILASTGFGPRCFGDAGFEFHSRQRARRLGNSFLHG